MSYVSSLPVLCLKLLLLLLLDGLIAEAAFPQRISSLQRKNEARYSEALSLSQQGNAKKSRELLAEIVKDDSTFFMAHFALADLDNEAGQTADEIVNLRRGIAAGADSYPPAHRFLAAALFKEGRYAEGLSAMEHYAAIRKILDPAGRLLLESCQLAVAACAHPLSIELVNAGDSINSDADEYWPSLGAEANKLIFTRMLRKDSLGNRLQRPQEDFYLAELDAVGWHKARPIGPPVNTAENEGAQTLSADGRLLIFTGCGRPDGLGSCDLYLSIRSGDQWSVPVNMGEPVNSAAWESQPSLSANGETLFFVSSRAGGKGKMDIWMARKTGVSPDGLPVYGKITNVEELNTAGNDLSPFLHADGKTCYLASDGRPGLGGSDLFISRLSGGKWSKPVNLGFPINTRDNEEGLIVETAGARGWFSSNRIPAQGRDIYYFSMPDSLRPEAVSYVKGIVTDAVTGKRISAAIEVTNLETDSITQRILPTENRGEFLVCLPAGNNYGMNLTAKGYLFASENFPLQAGYLKDQPKMLEIRLQPLQKGAVTTLKNIFFETNSAQLTETSRTQLDELCRFMTENPGVMVEIGGHTDQTGNEKYNLELSARRAEAVALALKKRNVQPGRIVTKGYGFSRPVGDNSTESGRSANRRTTFSILEINVENEK